jgi:hypothetical protein
MSSVYLTIIIFLVVALVALAVVWWYARRVKQDLDDDHSIVAGAQGVIELRPESIAQLRALSTEPIHRPMMPLMAFIGKDVSSALNEAAGEVSERYGVKWVVLVSAHEDGRVTVQRLA